MSHPFATNTFYAVITFNRTIPMMLLRAIISTTPITNLALVAMGVQGSVTSAHFLPHGHETVEQVTSIAAAASQRQIQTLLEETACKLNKVVSKSIVTSTINSVRVVVGACANTTVLAQTLVDFDATSLDASKVPFLHLAARKIAILLTSKETVEFTRKNKCNADLYYYAFGLFDRTHAIVAKVLNDEGSIRAANPRNGNGNAANVTAAHFKMASNTLDKGLTTLIEVIAEAETLVPNAMFANSIFGPAAQAGLAAAAVKRRAPPANADHNDGPIDKKQKKKDPAAAKVNVGAINSSTTAVLNLPTEWPAGETGLCPAELRNGSKGCKKPDCNKNHKRPKNWSKEMLAIMIAHVKAESNLTWNYKVATPDILGLKLTSTDKV